MPSRATIPCSTSCDPRLGHLDRPRAPRDAARGLGWGARDRTHMRRRPHSRHRARPRPPPPSQRGRCGHGEHVLPHACRTSAPSAARGRRAAANVADASPARPCCTRVARSRPDGLRAGGGSSIGRRRGRPRAIMLSCTSPKLCAPLNRDESPGEHRRSTVPRRPPRARARVAGAAQVAGDRRDEETTEVGEARARDSASWRALRTSTSSSSGSIDRGCAPSPRARAPASAQRRTC